MGYRQKLVYLALTLFLLISCGDADMAGMFIGDGSANKRFDASQIYNSTHPYVELTCLSDEYDLYVMGDSHIGDTLNMKQFFKDAINGNALAAVLDGDLCTGKKEDYLSLKNILPPPDSLYYFPLIGNHELYFNGWNEYVKLFGTSAYYFTVKTPIAKDLYLCLDSGSGTLGKNQLEWLKTILSNERNEYRNCIVFTHVNLFRIRHTFSTNPNIEEIYALTDLFAQYKVDMVITGHDHMRNVSKMGNTTHITLDALKDNIPNASYLRLKSTSGIYSFQFIEI